MSLKEELAKLEREEEIEDGEEARLNAMQEDIYRLHRRIAVVVEYVDKGEEEEEPLTEEEMWECGFGAGFEEGGKRAIMDAAKEQTKEESIRHSEYAKGYEDGVKALSKKIGLGSADQPNDYNMEIIKAIRAALATPDTDWRPLVEIIAMRNLGKEETDETEAINKKLLDAMQKLLRVVTSSPSLDEPKEKEPEKETRTGLGKKVGDV